MANSGSTAPAGRGVRLLFLAGDLLLVPVALLLAWQLRFGLQAMPADFFYSALALSLLVMLAVLPVRWLALRRLAHLPEAWRLALEALLAASGGITLILLLHGTDKVPRSGLVVLAPLLWLLWLAARVAGRVLLTRLLAISPYLQRLRGLLRMLATRGRDWLVQHWRLVLDGLLAGTFVALLVRAFLNRAAWTNRTFAEPMSCNDCMTVPLFLHDAWFLGALLLLFLLSFVARRFLLYLPLRLIALTGLLLYIGDLVLMDEFYTRLNVGDLRIYGEQLPLVWRHVTETDFLALPPWLVLALVVLTLLWMLMPPAGRPTRRLLTAMALPPVFVLVSGSVFTPPSYVHDWALRNVIASNLNTGVAVPYSDAYKQQVLAEVAARPQQCVAGAAQRPDIVLLVLESWSAYQSAQWGGMEDWTPHLDSLAREHAWYGNFHAGGYTTNEGLMAILAGLEFLAPVKSYFSIMQFETAWETPSTIPRALEEKGAYHTAFLTSGNLSFTRKGDWLRSIGFDYVEGHDHAGYEGLNRLHFDAPADEYLYARSLDYLREHADAGQPVFLTIENVSSHHPYIHPHTGDRSAEAVFRYMDQAAWEFYEGLRDSGHFDRGGLMLIVSDHRAMVPIAVEGAKRFGPAAASRVPAIVIGAELRGEITASFHQSDILPSLTALVADEYCFTGPRRSMLEPEQNEARCLYHARGDNRDHIDAFCPLADGSVAHGLVRLKGDQTQVLSDTGLSQELKERVVREVNTHRIVGDERTRRLIESGYFN